MASEPKPMSHERLLLIAQAHADQTLYDSDMVDLYDLVGELIRAHGYWLNEAEGLAVDVDEQRAEVARLRGLVDRAIEASDNDGGSASDAIQDMLAILYEADGEESGDE